MGSALHDAAVDLLLGGRCVGCERPGRVLCESCRDTLPTTAGVRWPSTPPAGLLPPFSTAPYEGLVRTLVVAHKERGLVGLRPVLGDLLAVAAATALADLPRPGPAVDGVRLVPVPSRASSVRGRGADPTHAITAHAASLLRAAGLDVAPARLLRLRPGVVDQSGLDRRERRANLTGSMACTAAPLRRLAGRALGVVICDDVLTTGSTVREAQRALQAVGVPVLGVACVAATPLRQVHRQSSGVALSSSPEED